MARYTARTRIDLGRDKDGKQRTFEVGDDVDLPQDQLDQLVQSGSLIDTQQQQSNPTGGTQGTGPATANTAPGVPQAPPGSPPPEKKEGGDKPAQQPTSPTPGAPLVPPTDDHLSDKSRRR